MEDIPDPIDVLDAIRAAMTYFFEEAEARRKAAAAPFIHWDGYDLMGAVVYDVASTYNLSPKLVQAIMNHQTDVHMYRATWRLRIRKDIEARRRAEAAREHALQIAEIDRARAIREANEAVRIASPTDPVVPAFAPRVTSPEEIAWLREVSALIVGRFPAREQAVLRMHFDEGLTHKEIGERLGMSGTRVAQVLAKTFCKIRRAVLRRELGDTPFR